MKRLLTTLALLSVLLTACSAPLGGNTLKPGETLTTSQGITITFVEVIEDSRCPADAMCVWQGNVKVRIEVGFGTEVQQYVLTLGELLEGDANAVDISGHIISLLDVQPYPLASQPASFDDYEITLGIN